MKSMPHSHVEWFRLPLQYFSTIVYGHWGSCHLSGVIYKREHNNQRLEPVVLLAYVWLAGLLIGVAIALLRKNSMQSVMHIVCPIFYSAPRRALLSLLPFFLSAFAVFVSHTKWILPLCGFKAIWVAVNCFLVCLYYGQSGWLAQCLFMFFDTCSLPVLFFYWLRLLTVPCNKLIRVHIAVFCILIVLFIVDYRIVTPYAVKFGFI